jgi:hypothetical protein
MKGRYIGECTQLICDLIDRCEDEEIPGLLILLDFEKAFDSLEWSHLDEHPSLLQIFQINVHYFVHNSLHFYRVFETNK